MKLTDKHISDLLLNNLIEMSEMLVSLEMKSEMFLKIALELKQRRAEDRQRGDAP